MTDTIFLQYDRGISHLLWRMISSSGAGISSKCNSTKRFRNARDNIWKQQIPLKWNKELGECQILLQQHTQAFRPAQEHQQKSEWKRRAQNHPCCCTTTHKLLHSPPLIHYISLLTVSSIAQDSPQLTVPDPQVIHMIWMHEQWLQLKLEAMSSTTLQLTF